MDDLAKISDLLNELQATNDRLRELLREFEWEHWDTKQSDHYCLICDANKKEGHKPDCRLAKELS